jgi:PAS domain S-box-containing protein
MLDRMLGSSEDPFSPAKLPVFFGLRQIIWLLRADGEVERFNPYWTEFTGLPARIAGLAWTDAVHPEDRQRLVAARTSGVASGEAYDVEARMRRVDGIYRRHHCRVVPMREGGRIARWIGTAIDIEDVRAAEDAAREAEARTRVVIQSVHQGYYRLDRAFRLVEVNTVFEQLTGKTRAEVLGHNLWTVFPGAPPAQTYTDVPFGSAFTEARWSGATRTWVQITIYRSPDGFEAFFRDITQERRAALWQHAVSRVARELRALDDGVDMTTLAAEVIGEALGLVRAGYVYIEGEDTVRIERDWVASPKERRSAGRYRLSDWGNFLLPLTAGESVVVEDVEVDPRTMVGVEGWRLFNVRSVLFLPLRTGERLDGYLLLHDDKPRQWTGDELDFVATISDLVWAALSRQRLSHSNLHSATQLTMSVH